MGVYSDQDFRIFPPNINNNTIVYNNNHQQNADTANIGDFYDGATVFVTGASGFLGKALLEKLLRSCSGIKTVQILLRAKRGMTSQQRLKELLENPVFDWIREKDSTRFQKIRIVEGDVSLPHLGLSERDRKFLAENVDIVFHSAATVRFNENLKDAVVLNTLGTKRVLELCMQMLRLKSVIHVSTAYSNADKKEVDEMVYPPPHDPQSIINCIEALPADAIEFLQNKLLKGHPNTYTLTKAMAEHIVQEFSGELPIAIVRPSIVVASWKEPFPGWVDNISGITGIMMEIGRGSVKSIICEENLKMDLIPVDIVVNSLITAAWHTAAYRSNTMRVYNCTSGQINDISWKRFGELTQRYAIEYPSKYVHLYPGFSYRTNRIMHWIYSALFHVLPACVIDVFLYCTKNKPIMLKICRKFSKAAKIGEFFALHEWNFQTSSFCCLIDAVKKADDGKNFEVDMRKENGFDWEAHVKAYMLGIRQYVLKDDLTTLPRARAKLNRLYWMNKIVQAASMFLLLRLALH